ncbi:MAG: TonB-dependent receptor [Novosphingobium sp.]|nr:TonB-dependent receptor [Novosphingobium sp.]
MRMASVSIAAMAAAIAVPALAQDGAQAQAEESSGGIAQIVVTAQKRAENVQDVPIAISAFSAEALQERAVSSVASLSNISPNVTLDAGTPFSGSSAVLSAYIRGIGANDFAFNIDPGVGVYLDGVYLARSVGANQDLPDVERIEVLKGPQGTLFGRNTIGGAISIVTHDPGNDFRFKGDVTTGRFGLLQTRGTVDVPLTDGLAASVSFSTKNRDGYVKRVAFPGATNFASTPITNYKAAGYNNIGLGTEGGDNSWNLRGKLRYDNKTNLRITLSGDYSKIDQSQLANTLISTTPAVFAGTYNCAILGVVAGNCGGGPPSFAYIGGIGGLNSIFDNPTVFGVNVDADPRNNRMPYDNRFVSKDIDVSYANGNNYSKMQSYGGSGTIEFDLSDTVMLKSITAYRELHWNAGMDLDGSPLNFLHTSFTMNQYQFSQELQLNGSAMDKTLNYVLGAYFFKEAGDLHDYVTFAEGLLQVDGPNDLSTKNYAFFGQVDYRPTEQFGITIGGRYTNDERQAAIYKRTYLGLKGSPTLGNPAAAGGAPNTDMSKNDLNRTDSKFTPKLGLGWKIDRQNNLYATYSVGFKGGILARATGTLDAAGLNIKSVLTAQTAINLLVARGDLAEEKATTWEVGVKSVFLDNRLQVNAAAFHTDYKGIQLNFQQGVSPTIQNAGDARIKGFEVEVVAAPTDGFLINASVGYTDAYYTAVLAGAQVAANPFQAGVFPGADLPKTPKWKFNVSPRYELAVGGDAKLVILGDWTHTTSLWNDTERAFLLQRGPTDIVNGNVTYKSGNHWDLTVGVTNITDERYLVTGQAQIAGGQFYGTYSRPREWFARLGVEF